MNISLDYKDVASKLFEQFREAIRDRIERMGDIHAQNIYVQAFVSGDASDNYLSNCVETFKYIDEKFYQELKEQIIWYIEGEIQGP